jgi:hypothetical protein
MSMAPRLGSLSGVRVGFVDNAKHMAQQMLNAVQDILKTEYGVGSFDYFRKKNASIPIPPDVVAKMATHCDAIVHGVGD